MNQVPYPHQIVGTNWLVDRLSRFGRALLLDDMGLGKTKQAIDSAALLREKGIVGNVVVICPKTLVENWQREIATNAEGTIVPVLRTDVKVTTKADRIKRIEQQADWTILHYEAARTLAENLASIITDRTLVICDEAHALKNQKADVTKAVVGLLPKMVILMTGTPIANTPEDAFQPLQIVTFDTAYKSWWAFRKWHLITTPLQVFTKKFDKKGKAIYRTVEKVSGYRNLEKLEKLLAKYGIRRTMEEVLDLPPIVFAPRFVELEPEQRQHYDEMKKELRTMVELASGEELVLKAQDILTQVTRLYQIASGILQIQAGEEYVQHIPSAKLEALEEIVDELGGQKVIVWVRHRAVMQRLYKHFAKLNPAQVHGGITDRQNQVDRFNNDPTCKMFLGQLQSAHQGINLEKNCCHAVFFERMFSPYNNDQATNRIRRIGQTKRQMIIPIIAARTVDEKLTTLLEKKADWRETILRDKAQLLDFIG